MTLREILHAHIPWLTMDSTLRDAVDKMDIYQFPALVVVDENQYPIGVLTEGDLARVTINNGNISRLANEKASKFMTHDPVTEHADAEIGDTLHLMLSKGLTILPVVQDKRLLGIVLRIDLMQALICDQSTAPA